METIKHGTFLRTKAENIVRIHSKSGEVYGLVFIYEKNLQICLGKREKERNSG